MSRLHEPSEAALPIFFVSASTWPQIRGALPPTAAAFAQASNFEPKPGSAQLLPDASGAAAAVIFAIEEESAAGKDLLLPGKLAGALPPGLYRFANEPHDASLAALSWLLTAYKFGRYRPASAKDAPQLCAPAGVDAARIERIAAAVTLGRDLINTPANDLGPAALEAAALAVAAQHQAGAAVTRGEALLAAGLPLIHAVGRASADAPRLVDFCWGDPAAPKLTLVGKGVCFDSGGLDIKPSAGMLMMKKDMGGAATALALASMIMDAGLNVRLRVILPIVENAISGDAFRPGDVYASRKGLTVEIGNTDAEGRLILADALALGDEDAPDLLIDFATLTGAARVALGPDLPPFYTADEGLAAEIARFAGAAQDPVWRMPLWDAYDKMLDSKIADLNNVGGGPFAGSITAALFLRRFVSRAKSWAHFDLYGWTPTAKAGRPEGGEIQAARLVYDLIEARYGGPAPESPRAVHHIVAHIDETEEEAVSIHI
ncbi:leucyl aminopeptidase [Methylocella silvestris]|uniref:Leucyl aminopeptidase n=1 Tax=Methylocella silvestris TaxID=199596 RepID=A0A2J7TDU8_METSI|nr:leucyl aminopeptidase family protein [Methylocella silvestris]PNG24942.1 leucyl aminopeptidase [Methylocella silvestris]